jgi:hypothetical protein
MTRASSNTVTPACSVEGDSWADLFQNYDVTAGSIWILILLWIAAGPASVRAIAAKRSA